MWCLMTNEVSVIDSLIFMLIVVKYVQTVEKAFLKLTTCSSCDSNLG